MTEAHTQTQTETQTGTPLAPGFYVVGTPIGNLQDLTPRAAAVLTGVDAVICEDTRRTGKLISHAAEVVFADAADFARPALLVGNEHTERARLPEVLERLDRGERLALVTDAGMPTVSDPGTPLVAAVAAAGHQTFVVPGPSAVSAALAVSGLLNGRYVFEGFLPRKGRSRSVRLTAIAADDRVAVLYESPNRLTTTLQDLAAVCGPERQVAVARELTKLHEEVVRASVSDAAAHYANSTPKGEIVIVVEGKAAESTEMTDSDLLELLEARIDAGVSRRDAVAAVMEATGTAKRRVYDLANSLDRPGQRGGHNGEPADGQVER